MDNYKKKHKISDKSTRADGEEIAIDVEPENGPSESDEEDCDGRFFHFYFNSVVMQNTKLKQSCLIRKWVTALFTQFHGSVTLVN